MTTIEREAIDMNIDFPSTVHTRLSATQVGIVTAGGALAASVGVHGDAPWPALRAVVAVAASALVLLLVRGAARVGAWATIALGLAGVVVGAGIGPSYAVATGFSVTSVAGIAALLSGLMLAGSGTVALTRRAHGWRRLLVVPAVPAVIVMLV